MKFVCEITTHHSQQNISFKTFQIRKILKPFFLINFILQLSAADQA